MNRAQAVARMLADGDRLQLTVTGECMSPLLCDGDEIVAHKRSTYLPGDVLVFAGPEGEILVHRLLGRLPGGRCMTAPDRGEVRDALFARERIVGRVVQVNGARFSVSVGARIGAIGGYFWHCFGLGWRWIRERGHVS